MLTMNDHKLPKRLTFPFFQSLKVLLIAERYSEKCLVPEKILCRKIANFSTKIQYLCERHFVVKI